MSHADHDRPGGLAGGSTGGLPGGLAGGLAGAAAGGHGGDHAEDRRVLHGMGYAQELQRSMSRFSNFAISFSIICILSGGINSFAQAVSSVGGAGGGIGWIVGCALSGLFALAMAQIASAFPTAGGLYHWASILGGRFWGWLTAWLNLLGLITVLGAINIGTALFFQGTFGGLIGMDASAGHVWAFVAVVTGLQALINHLGIRLTAALTDFSGTLIFVTTAVLIVACLAFAPSLDLSRLWTFTNYSGEAGGDVFPRSESTGYLFLLCLLLPVYTITGYDASAHTAEETVRASHAVPRSIVSAVVWSSLIGWLMIMAIILAIPDMDVAASQGWGMFFATMDAILPAWLRTLLYVAIVVAQLLCGLATVTSASRMLFAFSRDDGMPVGSRALAKVSPRYRTPVAATWTAALLCILYVFVAQFVSIGGTNLYTIVVNSTLVFLFLSFTIPLVLGALAFGGPRWPIPGPWSLGGPLYRLVTLGAVIGMAVILFIAVQPPNGTVLWIVVGFLLLAGVLWVTVESRRFRGPPTGAEIARRQALIAQAERAVGETA